MIQIGRLSRVTFSCLLITLSCAATAQKTQGEPNAYNPATDTFNCADKALDWMTNCESLNQEINQNKTTPVRTVTKEGVELFFIPGTPKALIKLQILRTPDAAKEFADYLAATKRIDQESAALMRVELAKRQWDRVPSDKDLTVVKYRDKIDYDAISLFVFYDSKCDFCVKEFPIIASLQELHPKLIINMLQMNSNPADYKRITQSYRFKSRMLSANELNRFRSNIKGTPTFLIQNSKTNGHLYAHGFKNILQLEQLLAAVSGARI